MHAMLGHRNKRETMYIGWVVVLLSVQSVLVLVVLVALQRRFNKLERRMERETAQTEALLALEKTLRFERPLPPSRGWAASPDLLRFLVDTVRSKQPASVVECGSGLSTLVIARALQLNGTGHVYSMDHSAEFASSVREQLEAYGVSDWATVIHAPLTSTNSVGHGSNWYDSSKLPDQEFDMIVIDGPPHSVGKMARYPAGALLFSRLKAGGLACLDDANRSDERKIAKLWRHQFPQMRQRYVRFDKGLLILERSR